MIPDDAVGVVSQYNDRPLYNKDNTSAVYTLQIVEKQDRRIVLSAGAADSHAYEFYLGGVVSSDRQTVFWVNETEPLP